MLCLIPYLPGLSFVLSFKNTLDTYKTEPGSSGCLSLSVNASWPRETAFIHFTNRNDQRQYSPPLCLKMCLHHLPKNVPFWFQWLQNMIPELYTVALPRALQHLPSGNHSIKHFHTHLPTVVLSDKYLSCTNEGAETQTYFIWHLIESSNYYEVNGVIGEETIPPLCIEESKTPHKPNDPRCTAGKCTFHCLEKQSLGKSLPNTLLGQTHIQCFLIAYVIDQLE